MELLKSRREFLGTVAATSIGALVERSMGLSDLAALADEPPEATRLVPVRLEISELDVEMIDLRRVFMRQFRDPLQGPSFMAPLISVIEGDVIDFTIINSLLRPHEFAIPGVL